MQVSIAVALNCCQGLAHAHANSRTLTGTPTEPVGSLYKNYAADSLKKSIRLASKPTKQAVIALGSVDDCGFSPFSIDEKPNHGSPDFACDVEFQKIAARVEGTKMAAEVLGVR